MSTGCMASFQDATTDHADDQCQENISRSSKCHCKSGGHKSALNLYGPIYLFWTKTLFHHFSPGYLRQHVIIPGINKVYIYQEKKDANNTNDHTAKKGGGECLSESDHIKGVCLADRFCAIVATSKHDQYAERLPTRLILVACNIEYQQQKNIGQASDETPLQAGERKWNFL